MAGTKVLMALTAMTMVHNLMTMAFGNHEDMEKAIEMLYEVRRALLMPMKSKQVFQDPNSAT